MRVGHGFDIHRLQPGGDLIIGGVSIEWTHSLVAHSDGDVLMHAICDSILGAAGLGDIGQHFPDTDMLNSRRESRDFLIASQTLVREADLSILHIDCTVVAENPKLSPYFESMKANIAAALSIEADSINIKAKTAEGLGVIGRGQGIAAFAVALLATCQTRRST
ncbi:MAG: 2-C-methyl-D-erythritol 2,4-cyclodiphosphate synthase [Acidiferrobacteraceae bacterium]|nr:2-C-methyl-D-erythritol 2,4-cyclodiphosphate synthase [Acidiferrobacteraceae bacterium]|tara:strand:- start:379 stop:870 length:492 start_codon:yes stop_codon:yes gene_type:complete